LQAAASSPHILSAQFKGTLRSAPLTLSILLIIVPATLVRVPLAVQLSRTATLDRLSVEQFGQLPLTVLSGLTAFSESSVSRQAFFTELKNWKTFVETTSIRPSVRPSARPFMVDNINQ
jgi:hypothetical protein